MKNIAIYGKSISENNLKFLENLIDALNTELSPEIFFHDSLKVYDSLVNKLNISFFGDQDLVKNKIDLLISFGGDGTLLDTVTMIKDSNIPVLGINAGRLGFLANITQEDIILAVKALKNRFEIYRDAKSKAEDRDVPLGEGVSLVRDMFVAETMEEAEKMAGEHIINYMKWVCHWRGLGNHMNPDEELPETKHKLDLLNYDFLHKRNLLFGTPEYVVNKINELKSELNLQNLQVWSNFPGIEHDACMRSIKLFNDEVIPKINLDNSNIEKAS